MYTAQNPEQGVVKAPENKKILAQFLLITFCIFLIITFRDFLKPKITKVFHRVLQIFPLEIILDQKLFTLWEAYLMIWHIVSVTFLNSSKLRRSMESSVFYSLAKWIELRTAIVCIFMKNNARNKHLARPRRDGILL